MALHLSYCRKETFNFPPAARTVPLHLSEPGGGVRGRKNNVLLPGSQTAERTFSRLARDKRYEDGVNEYKFSARFSERVCFGDIVKMVPCQAVTGKSWFDIRAPGILLRYQPSTLKTRHIAKFFFCGNGILKWKDCILLLCSYLSAKLHSSLSLALSLSRSLALSLILFMFIIIFFHFSNTKGLYSLPTVHI